MTGAWAHLLPPGEVYSPASGGSLGTVAAELTREHARHGRATVIVADRAGEHLPSGVRLLPYDSPGETLGERERREDDEAAARGGRREHYARFVRPAVEALPPEFGGPVVLHNAVAAVPELRRLRPRARVCLYLHADMFRSFPPAERARVVAEADLVVCVSRFVAERFLDGTGLPLSAVAVVHNGHDPARFHPAARRSGDVPVVLFAGRLAPEKGPMALINACLELARAGARFRLRVVGNAGLCASSAPDRFERQVKRRASLLGDRVEFSPFVDRAAIGGVYREADVLCVPSLCEDASPLVLTEGMASGLACLASARGGVPEVGRNAVRYFDYRRPGDLARQLGRLLHEPALRAELGRRALRRGRELTWETRYRSLWSRLTEPAR
ncbi:glycosyltransferase family 4 protein [Nonomuraea sp. 3-1Str]|uniref:glycosyltransferase family 4 protein n=1 Tax=Nonomuraea sp. 3-1Str TaxID=2929801 RepID=UPI00285DB01E|nr:glycosyltransferase family 4 protein [Nonomuraea sp. 3-1Str]MDR8413853.1 glycosyltransferase family 4 protein [Nonomuraea sp. 3-1Str]